MLCVQRRPLLERDLQSYLFEHPETLFPGEIILEKSREFCVHGKRIDLLFRTKDARYIIELKAVPLSREHIGQVVEYYGMMRDVFRDGTFKMVLVAPSIPEFRQVFLNELGIRCVSIPGIPSEERDLKRIQLEAFAHRKQVDTESRISNWLPEISSIRYEQFVTSVTRESLAISHRILRDSLADLREAFSSYEMLPIKMARADSPDVICETIPANLDSPGNFERGGVWWAYAFGESEHMPKNDVPNISAMVMPWCFDLTVNAELRKSQAVMRERIAANPSRFDELLSQHGGIQFHALLKLEHQPRFYHWIPLVSKDVGTWCATSFLETSEIVFADYLRIKNSWISIIEERRPELSSAQKRHMQKRNRQPNLALRLVRSFPKADPFWSMPYAAQRETFVSECQRLKPFIDFFR
jgi:hypothetical protein